MKRFLLDLSTRHPKWVMAFAVLITLAAGLQFPKVVIDTDPENMLPADEPVRIHHHEVKEVFGLSDFLVVGLVHEDGVFTPPILERVARLTEGLAGVEGVVFDDVLAPTEVDDILAEEGGGIRVQRLMEEPPTSLEESREILARIHDNPLLRGKLASDDGQAMALFIPLEKKEHAAEVAAWIRGFLEGETHEETYHIAGLPVAEDTFGLAMFQQMAYSAPLAFLLIFLLMLYFFRRLVMVAAPMLVAILTVVWTMGLLIGMGFTVHIMSSMIPIFLIPIAVLDSIHILSEVHDHYRRHDTMRKTLEWTYDELFWPMAFTSLTTLVGFAALIATPIPPVQVFGAFVAVGVFVAWLLSMTFTPAYAMLVPARALESFGASHEGAGAPQGHLQRIRRIAIGFRAPLVAGLVVLLVLAGVGISRIVVNDNPTNWFKPGHPIRVADRVMNDHLAGTYIAYLELTGTEEGAFLDPVWMAYVEELQEHLASHANVGGVTSVADVVKKVQVELLDRAEGSDLLPDSREKIAQYLFLYEISGGDPEDLFKFVTAEHDRANLWVQMPKGENRDVKAVLDATDVFLAGNPPPPGMEARWAGLSYINVVWQERMVSGMGKALMGSFVMVFIMMVLLFRSLPLGLVAMIPLSSTILMTYGFVGWLGRPYDMPIAVLSSLSLGLSIDFAIHFLQRSRELVRSEGSFAAAMEAFFRSPAQALARNIVVIALGFVPMFFASLVPYQTVGAYFFAIMVVSGGATFLILPAVLSWFPESWLAGTSKPKGSTMKTAGVGAAIALALVLGVSGPAQAEDAEALMKAAHLNLYYAADDGVADVQMTITDKRGKEREREFVMLRRDFEEGGEQRYFVYFRKPSDVRRMTFMAWKDPADDDRRWIFVPALDLIKPVSANDKTSSFVGSDFSYEDVSGRHWSEDSHTVLRTEDLDGVTCTVVESRPQEKDWFTRKLTWIDPDQRIRREEVYDQKDELEKVLELLEYEDIDGVPTATLRRMSSPQKNSLTEIRFSAIRYDTGVEEKVFSERSMKSPPREYVQ